MKFGAIVVFFLVLLAACSGSAPTEQVPKPQPQAIVPPQLAKTEKPKTEEAKEAVPWVMMPAPEGVSQLPNIYRHNYEYAPYGLFDYSGFQAKDIPKDSPCEWNGKSYLCPKGVKLTRFDCKPSAEVILKCFPKVTWEAYLDSALKQLWQNQIEAEESVRKWGKLGNDNHYSFPIYLFNPMPYRCTVDEGHAEECRAVKGVFLELLKDKEKFEALITWGLDIFVPFFQKMPARYQHRDFLKPAKHALAYAQNFDWERERRYLAGLHDNEKGRYAFPTGKHRFTRVGPDGNEENPHRELEAFIFRRVRDGMDIRLITKTLQTVVDKLEPYAKKD